MNKLIITVGPDHTPAPASTPAHLGKSFPTINPATGETICTVQEGDKVNNHTNVNPNPNTNTNLG